MDLSKSLNCSGKETHMTQYDLYLLTAEEVAYLMANGSTKDAYKAMDGKTPIDNSDRKIEEVKVLKTIHVLDRSRRGMFASIEVVLGSDGKHYLSNYSRDSGD